MVPPRREATPARAAPDRMETTMALRSLAFLTALAAAGAASAGPGASIERLAGETGLREREVRMLAGAPSAFAEYRTSYRRLSQDAARRGLDLRSLALIARHARELDRAVAFSLRADARRGHGDLFRGALKSGRGLPMP
jgi:hypothetical protein